jgi:hypothetical protein
MIYSSSQQSISYSSPLGTAGYGNASWAISQSFADGPLLTPVLYDPDAPAGSKWSQNGFSPTTVPRMYHSSATLIPDGRSPIIRALQMASRVPFIQQVLSLFPDLTLTRTIMLGMM